VGDHIVLRLSAGCLAKSDGAQQNLTHVRQWAFEIDQKWRADLQLAKPTQTIQKRSAATFARYQAHVEKA